MKVLLVDDQGLIREGLVLQLKLLDPSMQVVSCGDLKEARVKIREHAPDFIFLDISLYGDKEAGLHFLDTLKEEECDSRIIMLSSQDDPRTVGTAIGSGAVGFITKNSEDLSSMRRAMEMVIQGGIFISDEIRERRGTPPPTRPGITEPPVMIRTVGPNELGITASRVYEVLWHLYQGVKGYKKIARVMGITEGVAEEYARDGYSCMHVQGKDGFFLKLMHKGWKLKAPRVAATPKDKDAPLPKE